MKRLTPMAFRALFFKHVFRFLGNVATPQELEGPHCLGVSGGLDSMALLWFASELHAQKKIGSIRVIFIHHHTRVGQDNDSELVRAFCHKRGIPFKILHAEGLTVDSSNFEHRARVARRKLLLEDLAHKELLWLGHHLNDSHEWCLMQRNRSHHPKSTLGIPVRNGPVIRPFLCVSRPQLETLVKNEQIPYSEDPTNADLRFDRNYVRHVFIPHLKRRYPKYLKHYSVLSNYLAMIQNLNITNRIGCSSIHMFDQGALIQGYPFSPLQIQDLLHTYSKAQRGELTTQILRMLKAIDNEKKGPFHFSGGTEAYYSYKLLMIYPQRMKNYDGAIARVLRTFSDKEFREFPEFSWKDLGRSWENLLRTSDALLSMPGLVLILEENFVCKVLNASVYDSLFPQVSQVVKEKQLCFVTSLKCLELWKRKKEKLPEKLRLLPLWSLTNLFPSQA